MACRSSHTARPLVAGAIRLASVAGSTLLLLLLSADGWSISCAAVSGSLLEKSPTLGK
ncbi:unnamed protein product [Ectocarpus sp. 12 AP-2014]